MIQDCKSNIVYTNKKEFSILTLSTFFLCCIYSLHIFLHKVKSINIIKDFHLIMVGKLLYEILLAGILSIILASLYCVISAENKYYFIFTLDAFITVIRTFMTLSVLYFLLSNIVSMTLPKAVILLIFIFSTMIFDSIRVNLFQRIRKKRDKMFITEEITEVEPVQSEEVSQIEVKRV